MGALSLGKYLMRAGNLRHRATILSLSAALSPQTLGSRWVGIRAKDGGDVPPAGGLRTGAMVEVRARYADLFAAGRYLLSGARLLHITSTRDPMGTGAELVLSCDELIGQTAEYRPAVGVPLACRAHITHEAPWLDELGQVTDYKTRAELAVIEVGRPQVDDQLLIAGQLYNVIAYAADSDDGIVRGLWLEVV